MATDTPEWRDRVQALLDKQEIHEVLVRYCRGVDRCDEELINSAFHPDAIDEHGPHQTPGADCGAALIARIQAGTKACMHAISNESIDVRGDVALCESYFLSSLVIDKEGKEYTRLFAGRYVDRFERREGEWKIAHRIVVHEWDRLDPVDAHHFPRPLAHLQGRRSKEDASYRIPAPANEFL